jgi:hypothetical protein
MTLSGQEQTLFSWVGLRAPQVQLLRSQGFSALAHAGVILLLLVGPRIGHPRIIKSPPPPKVPRIKFPKFVPDVQKEREAKPVRSPLLNAKAQMQTHQLSPKKPVKVNPEDLKHLRIAFDPDNGGYQVHEVMKKLDSQLVFVSPEDNRRCENSRNDPSGPMCFCHLRFDPGGHLISNDQYSYSGFFAVKIGPPDPPFVTALRTQNSIPSDFEVLALLPSDTRLAIEARVVQEAQRIELPPNKKVTSVEIVFKAEDPNGFSLKELSTTIASEGGNTDHPTNATN